jgi:hypothetical protein
MLVPDELRELSESVTVIESSLAVAADCIDRGYQALVQLRADINRLAVPVYHIKADDSMKA